MSFNCAKYYLLGLCVALLFPASVAADNFPAQHSFAGEVLQLNGKGIRSKLLFNLYTAGLYLKQSERDANAILQAEQPMALRLEITSAMITSETMEAAVRDGFERSAEDNLPKLQSRIEQLINIFKQPIQKGDLYDFVYQPQSLRILKNKKPAGSISGADFKQAFYGIWLGNQPVQARLKRDLLGNGG